MKTFTQTDIVALEDGLKRMLEGANEIKLSEVTQTDINELVELFNIIMEEYATLSDKENKVLGEQKLEDLSENSFHTIVNIMNEAASGIVEYAKQNVEG